MKTEELAPAPQESTATLKPIDLARSAGMSASSVRMYETEGFIEPAVRTAHGHRRYTQRHLRALHVARTLRSGYGWVPARTVMRAVHGGDFDAALQVTNQRHAQLHRESERLSRAIEAIEGAESDTRLFGTAPRWTPIGAAARALGVTTATLRHWEAEGTISPSRHTNGRRYYSPGDLRQLELVQVLRAAGYSFEAIAQLMASLKTNDRTRTRRALGTRQEQLRRESRAAAAATGDLIHLIEELSTGDPSR